MKYFDDDGSLDLEAASATLKNNSKLGNPDTARRTIAAISAAALVDIAGSLRVLAHESATAMSGFEFVGGDDEARDEHDDEPTGDEAPPLDVTELMPGTAVQLKTPDHKGRYRTGKLTGVDGIDQGEPWVGVQWNDAEDGIEARVFASMLEVYTGEATEPDDEDAEPVTTVFDDDFGATPPTALDALEAKTKKKAKKK